MRKEMTPYDILAVIGVILQSTLQHLKLVGKRRECFSAVEAEEGDAAIATATDENEEWRKTDRRLVKF
jgi:hypothetical protein